MSIFSERLGFKPVQDIIYIDEVPEALFNRLCNHFFEYIRHDIYYDDMDSDFYYKVIDKLWKQDLSNYNTYHGDRIKICKSYCKEKWYHIYDVIELFCKYNPNNIEYLEQKLNPILEEERSGYRLLKGVFIPITEKIQIQEIETALNRNDIQDETRKHLDTAIEQFKNRENTNYGDVIKNSIHAVETIAQTITGKEKAKFGELMATLKEHHELPISMELAFKNLYGYTNNEDGIRHAFKIGQMPPTETNARYILVICSAFINFAMDTCCRVKNDN